MQNLFDSTSSCCIILNNTDQNKQKHMPQILCKEENSIREKKPFRNCIEDTWNGILVNGSISPSAIPLAICCGIDVSQIKV